MDVKDFNIYHKPLHQHSTSPMTGFKRDGYCRAPAEDKGNHSIAATVTDAFLDFSAKNGNDLRKQVGLKGGQKWCLCASRWKEAYDAREKEGESMVPKVHLHATHESALKVVDLKDLKKFAAEGEASNASTNAVQPTERSGGLAKKSSEISAHTGGEKASASVEGDLRAGSRGYNS